MQGIIRHLVYDKNLKIIEDYNNYTEKNHIETKEKYIS